MESNEDKIKVGITHGDINGIGYEIIIKTLSDNRINELCTPIVYGSPKIAAYHRKTMGVLNFSLHSIKTPDEANVKRSNIINCCDDNIRVELGKSTEFAGEASLVSLEAAVADLKSEKIDVLVTCPINKYNIQSDNFQFPGHTEYLMEQFNCKKGLMLMVSDRLKVGVVTGHVPISKVASMITKDLILEKLRILNQSLIEDFGREKPIIAVFGLNPHAGDNGIIGTEEQQIIIPAIQQARDENIMAIGPYPADGFFGSARLHKFDAVLAMYHDQGLAPFKSLVFEEGVNYTAGLPIIRTSPAHGTAYEIAGENQASPVSFQNAIYLALDIFNNRQIYKETTANAMKKMVVHEDVRDEDIDITKVVDDSPHNL